MPASGTSSWVPALCTTICGGPSASTGPSAASVAATSVRSQASASAEPPAVANLAAQRLGCARRLAWAWTITCAPSAASRRQIAAPIGLRAAGDQGASHADVGRTMVARPATSRRPSAAETESGRSARRLARQRRPRPAARPAPVVEPAARDLDVAQRGEIAGRLRAPPVASAPCSAAACSPYSIAADARRAGPRGAADCRGRDASACGRIDRASRQ